MIENKYPLTLRQYALRDLLEKNSDHYMTADKIFQEMSFYYPYEEKQNFTGTVGRAINKDIQYINKSAVFQKIIISSRARGYKLANKEEYKKYSVSKWKEHLGAIKRLADLDKRYELDGQMKLPLEPYGKPIIETFIPSKSAE